MKKILFIIVVCSLCLGIFFIPASAADDVQSYVINPGSYSLNISEYGDPFSSYEFELYFPFVYNGENYYGFTNYGFSYSFICSDTAFTFWYQGEWYCDPEDVVIIVDEPSYVTIIDDKAECINYNFPGLLQPYSGSDIGSNSPGSNDPVDPPDLVDPASGIYYDIYDVFASFVYGDVELNTDQRLTATIISSLLCVTVFALPYIVVFWIIKFLLAWRL